ncbi:MAG: SDR family NAD(P)-dependent oxidoreductase, partial [Sphingomonadaceae bacterium]
VTGAGRGLGREHALAMAAQGAAVVVNDLGGSNTGGGHDTGPAEEVVAEIKARGGHAIADTSSISDWKAAAGLVDLAIETFGDIDIVVNNAGINRMGLFGEMTEQDWEISQSVIAKGTLATMNAAAAHWRKSGPRPGRAIVNTASPAGVHPVPAIGAYCAAKAAVVAMTQAAAQELGALGVRVNAIAPMARTRMLEGAPQEMLDLMAPREGFDPNLPEHVAQLVLYLVSALCPFTGRVFGGWGDQIFLFKEWDAAFHASNEAVKWTPESIAKALSAFPVSDTRYMLFPGGRIQTDMPPAEVLEALDSLKTV